MDISQSVLMYIYIVITIFHPHNIYQRITNGYSLSVSCRVTLLQSIPIIDDQSTLEVTSIVPEYRSKSMLLKAVELYTHTHTH